MVFLGRFKLLTNYENRMARFYITADSNSHQTAESACAEAQLRPDGQVDRDGFYLTTYQKRSIDSQNFQRIDNDSFVAVTGTLIINGKMGGDGLRDVYTAYKEGGPEAVRDRAFGHYAVILRDGDTVKIFCDPNSVYCLYYVSGDDWFASNSLALCGQSLDEPVLDRYGLYRRMVDSTEIARGTLFTDVSRLSARENIHIDVTTNEFRVDRLALPEQDWSYTDKSIDAVLSDYTSRVRDVFGQMSRATDRIGIQATGGIDSRTVLAGVLDTGGGPDLLYGVGNSKITNTKAEDREIVQQYADAFGLDYHELDWSGEYPIDTDHWDDLFTKYGFEYRVYGAKPNFYSSFEENIPGSPELILDGYAFGTHSNFFYWEDDSLVPLTFEELATDVFTAASDFSHDVFPCKDRYLDELPNVCEEALVELGEDVDRDALLDRRTLTRYIQLLNGRPQSTYVNVTNEFTYHLGPFATFDLGRPMVDFLPEHRVSEKIRIKLIKKLLPASLEIPVFSGTRHQRFTEDDRLEPAESERLAMWFGSVLPTPIVEQIRPIYDGLVKGQSADNTDIIFESHEERLREDGPVSDCFNLELYDDHIRRHARFALLEYGLDKIGYTDVTPR